MPGLRLFNRRWHISSDALPILAVVTGVFHLVWLLFFLFGSYNLENTGLRYECDQQGLLRAANYGLLATFFVSATVSFSIMGVGLRGGPLEPERRRAIVPLIYLDILLWLVLLGLTLFGTFVVASPKIAETCWKENPCATGDAFLNLGACKLEDGSRVPKLEPSCQVVWYSVDDFVDCWMRWFYYGLRWNETRDWEQPSDCPEYNPNYELSIHADEVTNNVTAELQVTFLGPDYLDIGYEPGAVSSGVPWWFCLTGGCQTLLRASDQCAQWDVLLNITVPESSNQKHFFEGLVYSSWGMLAITALVAFIGYNSFPDYSQLESWEGSLKGLANTCCCQSQLEAAGAMDGSGDPASREIAKSLHMLFGGIDLDPSDRLLGMYLLSEQQCRRRQRHVMEAMSSAGVVQLPGHKGVMRRAWRTLAKTVGHLARRSKRPPLSSPSPSVQPTSQRRPSGTDAERQSSVTPVSRGNHAQKSQAAAQSQPQPSSSPRPVLDPSGKFLSPFEQRSDSVSTQGLGGHSGSHRAGQQLHFSPISPISEAGSEEGQRVSGRGSEAGRPHGAAGGGKAGALLPMYRHSIVRLRTAVMEESAAAARAGAAIAEGFVEGEASSGEPGSPPALVPLGQPTSSPVGNFNTPQQPPQQQQQQRQGNGAVAIRLGQRYHPMLTPSGCTKRLPITPQEAANIYTGFHEPVPHVMVKEAHRISKFATAAYGLQSVVWAKGKRPAMCMKNVNMLLKCVGRPLRLENKLRKRNFQAIVDITGVHPSDLLYVSYANAPRGVLPYIIMLHRPSKSVVLAIRGTVSMEDLITDLLSSPLAVESWMPEWVREANASLGGEHMYVHAGIVGSATAILKDLEDKELLKELLYSQLVRTGSAPSGAPSFDSGSFSAMQALKGLGESVTGMMSFWQGQQKQQQEEKQQGKGGDLEEEEPSEWVQPPQEQQQQQQQQRLGNGTAFQGSGGTDATLPDLNHLGANEEVRLPLSRAKTTIRTKLQQEGWQVVVTGHSLGAAVACTLSFHLRDWFPDLHCWAFNPPGGLLSWNLSRIAQRFCTSTVVGKDVISRLSFNNSRRLVDEMVTLLARCKRPKLVVLADLLLKRRSRPEATPTTFCSYENMTDEAVHALEGYYKTSVLHAGQQVDMYPPGRLLFLRPFKGKRQRQTVWDAVWVEAPALMGEGILVSPSMMAHHRLFTLDEALRSALGGEVEQAQQGVAHEEQTVLASPV